MQWLLIGISNQKLTFDIVSDPIDVGLNVSVDIRNVSFSPTSKAQKVKGEKIN